MVSALLCAMWVPCAQRRTRQAFGSVRALVCPTKYFTNPFSASSISSTRGTTGGRHGEGPMGPNTNSVFGQAGLVQRQAIASLFLLAEDVAVSPSATRRATLWQALLLCGETYLLRFLNFIPGTWYLVLVLVLVLLLFESIAYIQHTAAGAKHFGRLGSASPAGCKRARGHAACE